MRAEGPCTANTTQTTPKEIGTQTNTGITPEQQIEIDKQVASRLQEVEIAKARAKDVPKQDSSYQYDLRDLDRLDNPRQYKPRLMEPASVGSTSTTQQRHRNTGSQTNQQSEPVTSTHSPQTTPLSRHSQSNMYNHAHAQNSAATYGTDQNSHHRGQYHSGSNYYNNDHNSQNTRCHNRDGQNSGGHWTSTPRDGSSHRNVNFNVTIDTTLNNSLVTLLDNHHRVQQDTTQALSKIIELQDTKANDIYVNDLPKFSGEPQQFLDWILKVEKIG